MASRAATPRTPPRERRRLAKAKYPATLLQKEYAEPQPPDAQPPAFPWRQRYRLKLDSYPE